MKPCSFVLPESFDPGEFLKTRELFPRFDDARYLVSLILTKLARGEVDSRKVVLLRAEYLKNMMYHPTYASVKECLLEGDAIVQFPYLKGERSFGFRLGARYAADKHVRIPVTDTRLNRRLQAWHTRRSSDVESRMKPVHHALAERQQRLQIDGNESRGILKGLPKNENYFDCQGVLIGDIENGEYHVSVGAYGRMSNNITNLKRELRQSLFVDGEPLRSVDLSCAQPALLATLTQNARHEQQTNSHRDTSSRRTDRRTGARVSQYDSSRQPSILQEKPSFDCRAFPEFDDDVNHWDESTNLYRCLVQSGEFYDFMVARIPGITRDDFKRKFMADVLAKKGNYPSIVENAFSENFPGIYNFIRNVNQDDHANLIRMLQRAESSFVIETVAADLITRYPKTFVIPLHDALYARESDIDKVRQAFERGFERMRFRMQLKVDS